MEENVARCKVTDKVGMSIGSGRSNTTPFLFGFSGAVGVRSQPQDWDQIPNQFQDYYSSENIG